MSSEPRPITTCLKTIPKVELEEWALDRAKPRGRNISRGPDEVHIDGNGSDSRLQPCGLSLILRGSPEVAPTGKAPPPAREERPLNFPVSGNDSSDDSSNNDDAFYEASWDGDAMMAGNPIDRLSPADDDASKRRQLG
ncbi:hypothetical protein CCHR01_16025 [Colletotrichum chrysophilum]|uniref:Uncharacterized protein n=1 Tax=Colletotrichum chrysophilum TaxID=1836956 RepID=A0AAD9A597_9PEZI|nr:hypothetical protein CCHR01_16025 [Colletotrichum chrysophilum]